jgi:poly-gamma-glutamate synthesis protein (capsule biosynthesis protein)
MHPKNVGCLQAAGIDCCVLANNHVLDWDVPGLLETIGTLDDAGIAHAGAGRNAREAAAPAALQLHSGARVLVFSFAMRSSGAPKSWHAGGASPGINFLTTVVPDRAEAMLRLAREIRRAKRRGDIAIASVHWGPNFGYGIPDGYRKLAHFLIAVAGFDLVHGHSSHHAKAIEVYRDRLILYGCGDFITDYEGLPGHEEFRKDLSVMYVPTLAADGSLVALRMIPFQSRRFRLMRSGGEDAAWLANRLDGQSARYGARVRMTDDTSLALAW